MGRRVPFIKMHGAGNDYIYFDCFKTEIKNPSELAVKLSDRHKGIGGDGIILICPSEKADARMRMFNLDGSEGKMCGNAIRCVAKYVYDSGAAQKNEIAIDTLSGVKICRVETENGIVSRVTVDMGAAELSPEKIPVLLPDGPIVNRPVEIGGREYGITCVSMGNPHCVVFVDSVDGLELEKLGPVFEHADIFPDRVNTEFVERIDKSTLKMRVWERGSGETMACGTGTCAAAVASVLNGFCEKNTEIRVFLRGGELLIRYTDDTVFMTGGAERVFDGFVEIE